MGIRPARASSAKLRTRARAASVKIARFVIRITHFSVRLAFAVVLVFGPIANAVEFLGLRGGDNYFISICAQAVPRFFKIVGVADCGRVGLTGHLKSDRRRGGPERAI